jgi:hypothetical protein
MTIKELIELLEYQKKCCNGLCHRSEKAAYAIHELHLFNPDATLEDIFLSLPKE